MPLTFAGIELDRRKLLLLGAIVLGCAAVAFAYHFVDVEAIHRRAEKLDGALVFALMTILPMVGFPETVSTAVAGMRFGLPLGLALVSLSIALQMLLSYAIVKLAPAFFSKRLKSLRERLPRAAHTPLTLFTMLLPGVPYFAKNYVLPLAGVPLATFLLVGLPINIARSVVGLAFGDMSDDLTPARVAGFAVYFIVITVTCAWAFRRLWAQMKSPPPAAGGRKQPA